MPRASMVDTSPGMTAPVWQKERGDFGCAQGGESRHNKDCMPCLGGFQRPSTPHVGGGQYLRTGL